MSDLILKILHIARLEPISPMKISQKLSYYSQEVIFDTIDAMQEKQMVYFDVENDILLVLFECKIQTD